MQSKIFRSIISSLMAILMIFSCVVITAAPNEISAATTTRTVSGITPTVTTLYNGVTYSYYDLTSSSTYGNKDFSVVEFDLAQQDLYFDVVFAGDYSNEKAKTTTIVDNFNATNTEGKTAIAATNADLWMVSYAHARQEEITYNGVTYPANMKKTVTLPRGFNVSDGEIISSSHIEEEIPYEGDFQTFGVTSDYIPFLANPGTKVSIKNVTKGTSAITTDAINRLPVEDALVMYTDKGCLNNYALDDAYEIVIDFNADYTIKHGTNITGTVTAICGPDDSTNPTMQENRIILTARGTSKINSISGISVGDSINIKVETYDRWGKYDAYVQDMQEGTGGHIPLVIDGEYCHDTNSTLTNLYATSIVGYTAEGTVMMIALDSVTDASSSRYFKISQMSYLAKELGLVNAFLLDGGGSTTMVTLDGSDYKLQGTPSDGSERSVINAIVLSHGPTRAAQGDFTPAQPIEYPEDISDMRFDSDNLIKYFKDENDAEISYDSEENALKLTVTGSDPYYYLRYSKSDITLSADDYKYMVVTYKNPLTNTSSTSTAYPGGMFFCAGDVTGADSNMYKSVSFTKSNLYYSNVIDFSNDSYWTGDINAVRFDFFESAAANESLYIYSIVLCKTLAEAEALRTSEAAEANAHKHTFPDTWKKSKEGHYQVCSSCGESSEIEAHIYGDWTVVREPTTTVTGYRYRRCTICNYTNSETIPCIETEPTPEIISSDVKKYKPALDGLLDANYLDSASITLTDDGDNAVTSYITWYGSNLYICSVVTDDDVTSPGTMFFNRVSGYDQSMIYGDTVGYNIASGGWIGTDANGYSLWAFDDNTNTSLAKCSDGDITSNKAYVASTKTANGYVSEVCIPITTSGFFADSAAFDIALRMCDAVSGATYDDAGVASEYTSVESVGVTLNISADTAAVDVNNFDTCHGENASSALLAAPDEMKNSDVFGVDAALDSAYLNSYKQTFTETKGNTEISVTAYYLWDTNFLYIYADVTDPTVFSQGLWAFGNTHSNNGYNLPGHEINDNVVFNIITSDGVRGARVIANATNTQASGNAYSTEEDGYGMMTDVMSTAGIGTTGVSSNYRMVLDTFTSDYPDTNTYDYVETRLKSTGDGYVVELRVPHNINLFKDGTQLGLSIGAFDVQGNLVYGYGEVEWGNVTETATLSATAPCQHTWVRTTVEAPSTCGATGSDSLVCSACDAVLASNITSTDTAHEYVGSVTQKATCTESGTMTYTCGNCGDAYTESISATGHTVVTDAAVNATCTTSGLTAGSHCSVCDTVIVAQEVIPATGEHTLVSGENGTKLCGVCGYVSNLRVGSATIELGSDITMLIKVRKDAFEAGGYSNPYVEVVRNGETLNLVDYTVDGNYYVFPYKNWAPYQMGDVFTAVVHGTLDGADVVGEEVLTYSVKQYIERQFTNNPDDATLRTLLVDLLVYGYQHQLYNEYNLDAPLTTSDVITAADIETYATAELHKTLEDNLKTSYTTIDNPTLTWKAASVVLESTIEMVLKFEKIDTTGISVVFADADGNVIDTVTEFTADPNNASRLCAQTAKLTAVQLYDLVYVTAYKDGVAISNTVQYSVESYAARNLTNADVADLCIAMMKYGHSAEQYLFG